MRSARNNAKEKKKKERTKKKRIGAEGEKIDVCMGEEEKNKK